MILRLQHQRPDGEIDSYFLKPGRRYHIGRGSACEVRILDLKLSRKHCALEYGDNGWQAVDLMSTNGCTLNGVQLVGNTLVQNGSVIEAGQTKLTVAAIFDAQAADAPPVSAASVTSARSEVKDYDADHDHTETTSPEFDLEQEPLPDGPANAPAKASSNDGNAWEPEPNSEVLNKTDALIPNRGDSAPIAEAATVKPSRSVRSAPPAGAVRPTAVFRADDLRTDEDMDEEDTRSHAQEAAPAASAPIAPTAASTTPAADAEARTFFITVLGRRVGPLTRAVARELKARELKGTLTTADLEQYPHG